MRPSAATFFSNVARRTKSLPTPGLHNSTIKRTQTKVTLTQRGLRETRNQRLSGKHLSIIPFEFRLYLDYRHATLKDHKQLLLE